MNNKHPHLAKKLLISAIVAIVLLPFVYTLIRFSIYQTDQASAPITDRSTYQNWSVDGWLFDEPYTIFPVSSVPEQAVNSEYLFKRVRSPFPLLYDDDAILFLVCDLDEMTFSNERKRLKELCGECRDDFACNAAYVYAVRGGGYFYEYALIDEESHRITYISFQNCEFAKQYVDSSCLPNKL